jgi:hypothetical protein
MADQERETIRYGDFTFEAVEFAKANSMTLIDGPKLARMIASVQKKRQHAACV